MTNITETETESDLNDDDYENDIYCKILAMSHFGFPSDIQESNK